MKEIKVLGVIVWPWQHHPFTKSFQSQHYKWIIQRNAENGISIRLNGYLIYTSDGAAYKGNGRFK